MNSASVAPLKRVYFDHNATAPIAHEVKQAVPLWLESWGNPSSIHASGRAPKALVRDARISLARALSVSPLELVFTSGGSESNNTALVGVLSAIAKSRGESSFAKHKILLSRVEHPSVIRTAEFLRENGVTLDWIDVARDGSVDLEQFSAQLNEPATLVSMMFANNETGSIFPIREMAEIAHSKGALFHTDAVQALGKVPLNLPELGVDLASFSGHKFYALKGCGVLYARRGLRFEPLVHGGGQERHRRGGTENVLAIASLGLMCESSHKIFAMSESMRVLRDLFESRVLAEVSNVKVTGAGVARLPNTSSLVIDHVDGETLLMNLDMQGFEVSTGAACSSGSPEPSPALRAMGLTRQEAQSSLRVSFGWHTSELEVIAFTDALIRTIARLRLLSPDAAHYAADYGGHRAV